MKPLRAKAAPAPDGRVMVIDREATAKHGRTFYKWVHIEPKSKEVK